MGTQIDPTMGAGPEQKQESDKEVPGTQKIPLVEAQKKEAEKKLPEETQKPEEDKSEEETEAEVEEKMLPQSEVNRIVGDRLKEQNERTRKKYGDLDKLLEDANNVGKVREELKSLMRQNLQYKIGVEKGVPPSLIFALQGDTEDAMTAHAEQILKDIGLTASPTKTKREPPPVHATDGTGSTPKGHGLTEAEIKVAAQFGLPPNEYARLKKLTGG